MFAYGLQQATINLYGGHEDKEFMPRTMNLYELCALSQGSDSKLGAFVEIDTSSGN